MWPSDGPGAGLARVAGEKRGVPRKPKETEWELLSFDPCGLAGFGEITPLGLAQVTLSYAE